jgi:hypothetical protein
LKNEAALVCQRAIVGLQAQGLNAGSMEELQHHVLNRTLPRRDLLAAQCRNRWRLPGSAPAGTGWPRISRPRRPASPVRPAPALPATGMLLR